MAEYRRLAVEASDPEDMPGYLTAVRESEMAPVPPPLLPEYMQVAPATGHPKDPPDFLGYHTAIADSQAAPIIDISGSSSDDDDGLSDGDDDDLGGVDDA